jgi:bacillithiol system protein YtxJ
MLQWNNLDREEQLPEIIEESKQSPVIIFKHSTICSISSTAKNRLERQWSDAGVDGIKTYYLDLLAHRPVSNKIAEIFEVRHESPQLLLIRNGKCTYNASHFNIKLDELKKQADA